MAVTIDHYDQFVELMGDFATAYGGWPSDGLRIILLNSSHSFTATNTLRSQINANELSTAAGYTASDGAGAGKTLASVTSSQPSAGVWMLDAADVTWSASGGSIGPATAAVIFDDTISTPLNALLFDVEFGASQTAGDGTNFVITWNANGICRIT
jgi:hypothetical protein